MPNVKAPAKILVTGANGYIAVWTVKDFLDSGYIVRGTVRSEQKAVHLRKIFQKEVEEGRLEFAVVPDITQPGAFDEVVKGVDLRTCPGPTSLTHTATYPLYESYREHRAIRG